jgi:hypothetical protein
MDGRYALNRRHSPTAWRTRQIDPERSFFLARRVTVLQGEAEVPNSAPANGNYPPARPHTRNALERAMLA